MKFSDLKCHLDEVQIKIRRSGAFMQNTIGFFDKYNKNILKFSEQLDGLAKDFYQLMSEDTGSLG
jgi:hypothetical protein